jgi:VanZ family protein
MCIKISSLPIALILYLSFLALMLFYPYKISNPSSSVRTNVHWLPESNGIEIATVSALRSFTPPERLYNALLKGNGITLEIWLATKNNRQTGPARIISFSYNKYLRDLTLGQEGGNLILRLRTEKTDMNGMPELVVNDVFVPNLLQHIVVSYDWSEESIYVFVDNQLKTKFHAGRISDWDTSYVMVIGNEATGNRPWFGKIYKMAIYDMTLSHREILRNYQAGIVDTPGWTVPALHRLEGPVALYLFDEGEGDIVRDRSGLKPALDIQIPREIQVNNKVFLRAPYQNFVLNTHTMKDVLLNTGCFIPFGFLLHAVMKRKSRTSLQAMGAVIILGVLFTISVESIQYFIESRSSSLTDVINNTIGMMLGIKADKLRSYHMNKNIENK